MARKRKTAESDDVDDFYATLSRGDLFIEPDEGPEVLCNEYINEITQLRASEDPALKVKGMMLLDELRTAIIAMVYGGHDPASVPYRHQRHALAHPCSFLVTKRGGKWIRCGANAPDAPRNKTVNGPLRGIRAKCFWCQGNSADGVRDCAAINCFLWPFRMGTNPFYGRLTDSTGDEDGYDSDEEIEALDAQAQAAEQRRIDQLGIKHGDTN